MFLSVIVESYYNRIGGEKGLNKIVLSLSFKNRILFSRRETVKDLVREMLSKCYDKKSIINYKKTHLTYEEMVLFPSRAKVCHIVREYIERNKV